MTRILVVHFDLERPAPLEEVLRRQLPRRLGLEVEVRAPPGDLSTCFSAHRRQYDAQAVLRALAAAAGAGRILGITGADLFMSVFTHVLGAAQLAGPSALVSVHRLRPEAVGLPADPWLLEERLVKEAVHELGHTFGLRHCQDPACAMFSANNPDEVDLRSSEFRGECLRKYHDARASL